jgi:hypothetical protein
MRPNISWLLIGLGLLLTLAACARAPRATATPTSAALPTAWPSATASPTPHRDSEEKDKMPSATAPRPHPPELDRLVSLAVEDLAGRLDVEADQIELLAAEAVEWPDTSLGCPQPGMMYAQVITPGYRLILATGEKQYRYHTDRRERVVLCQTGSQSSAPSPKDVKDSAPWRPVDPVEPGQTNQ